MYPRTILHSGQFSRIVDAEFPRRLRVGTGRLIPRRFTSPNTWDSPQTLFPPTCGRNNTFPVNRFINATDRRQFLIYTGGAFSGTTQQHPEGGCAFVFQSPNCGPDGYASFALEREGPTGQAHLGTKVRAELRAVIAALRHKYWIEEGFNSLVIATASEYVVKGITEWVSVWLTTNWRTSTCADVKNRDLWECLLGEIEAWDDEGMEICFWAIPRQWSTCADSHAQEARLKRPHEQFHDV
ncbi:ribonuclease H-like domain-containing protein [Penicillium sp. IBT 18751x]|nr:ribonuclease H-like domain-containing protein [Penicillium sp. IBT 18751x]